VSFGHENRRTARLTLSAGNAANVDPQRLHGAVDSAEPHPAQRLSHSGMRWHYRGMIRDLTRSICATLPGAEVSDPWGGGHDAWKVGGKMFACIGAVLPGLNVKTDSIETAEMLIAAGVAERARYFHRSWVYLPEGTEAEEIRRRLIRSYDVIRAALPKKLRATPAPRADTA
jgi:predicted DNA-binding protein (MmcQ/YjbR family)